MKFYKLLLATIGKALPNYSKPFGKTANKFRCYCARHIVQEMGVGCDIDKGAVVNPNVVIENYGCVGVNSLVSPYTTIGQHAMMGPECLIYTNNHKFDKELMRFEGFTERKPVVIEEYAWIGARVIILPGITIGKGSVVGAGSVVTKNIPPYSVAGGNPARVIKSLLD